MMAQRGETPDPTKIPLDFYDLPYDAQLCIGIYHKLGNRVEGNIGFIGKDYTNLPILIEAYGITNKLALLEYLTLIEVFYIEENQKAISKSIEDNKRKAGKK